MKNQGMLQRTWVKTPYLLYIYKNHKIAEKQWPSSVFQTAAVGLPTAGAAAAKRVQTGSASSINTPDTARNLCMTHLLCPPDPSLFREADSALVLVQVFGNSSKEVSLNQLLPGM